MPHEKKSAPNQTPRALAQHLRQKALIADLTATLTHGESCRMKPKPEQEAIPLNTQELEAKLNEIERTMGAETAQPFRLLLGWVLRLQQLIEKKNITLKRLRHMIFGAPTERTSDLEAKQELPTPTGSEAEQAGVTSQEGGG